MPPSASSKSKGGSSSLCLSTVRTCEQQISAAFFIFFVLLWHGMKQMGFKACFVFLLCQAVNTEAEHDCGWLRSLTLFYFIITFFFAFLEIDLMDHKK